MIEVCFALLIFGAMAIVFATVFPVVLKSTTATGHYAQASSLGLHKLDQIRAAGFDQAQTPATLINLGIADAGSAQGAGLPYSVNFTTVDGLTSDATGSAFLPAGSTGTISVTDYNSVNSAVPAGNVLSVTATVLWPGGSSSAGQYSVSTLIAKVRD